MEQLTASVSDNQKETTMTRDTSGSSSTDPEAGGKIAYLVKVNADLQTRLEHKETEIHQLLQRLALYQEVAPSLAPPPVPGIAQRIANGSIPQEEERQMDIKQQEQQLQQPHHHHHQQEGGPRSADTIALLSLLPGGTEALAGHPPSQQQEGTQHPDLIQAQPQVNDGASLPNGALPPVSLPPPVRPSYLASSGSAIGDYHSINSNTLPLLNAAHMSRSHTTVTAYGLLLNQAPFTVGASDAAAGAVAAAPPLPTSSHNTDTASIRRMYMALEKGPGIKPDLLFLNPDIFFQTTVGVLEFEEDSPSFRRKLVALDENVEGMRNHLQRLVSIIGKYIEAGMAFSAVGRTFASELMHLQGGKPGGGGGGGGGGGSGSSASGEAHGESWFTRLGDLAPALVRFGETFDMIQSYNDAVLFSLESTFLQPMREFVKRELKEVKQLKEEVSRAHEDYLLYLQRYLLLKRGTDPAVLRARTQELIAVRRRYELGRWDLVNMLNQLETKKKFQLMERVLCALYAYLGYFHQGHQELATIENSMRDLQQQLRLSRREFSTQTRIAEAKRMQVELLLSTSITNISGIKAQLEEDDWAAMFDATTAGPPPLTPPAQPSTSPVPLGEVEARQEGVAAAVELTAGIEVTASPMATDAAPQQQLQHETDENPPSPIGLSYASSSSSSISSSPPASPLPLGHRSSVSSSSSSMMMSPLDAPGTLTLSLRSPVPVTQLLEATKEQDNVAVSNQSPSQTVSAMVLPSTSSALDDVPVPSPSSSPSRSRTNRTSVDGRGLPFYLKQGYLWKRSSNVMKDWKRRFFSIRNGKLSYQREDDPLGPPRANICELLISTVRECVRDSDTRFTFEILSPGKRPYMLQAENEMEFQEWIKALRSSTENLLMMGGGDRAFSYASVSSTATGMTGSNRNSLCLDGRGHAGSSAAAAALVQATNDFVDRIQEANPVCADCQSVGPKWACINFGTVICIKCSGIHRSLGVHVSKVRSLLLDAWPRSLRAVMEELGNERANQVWEARVPADRIKPAAGAAREEREAWIRDKWVGKAFVTQEELATHEDEEDPDAILYTAARKGDVGRMSWALAHGAEVNYVNEKERNRTPVHAVCQTGRSLAALEFLVLNGGSVDVLDLDDVSPLDLALVGNVAPLSGVRPGGGSGDGGQPSEEERQQQQQQARQQNQISISSAAMPLVSYLLSKLDKRIS